MTSKYGTLIMKARFHEAYSSDVDLFVRPILSVMGNINDLLTSSRVNHLHSVSSIDKVFT